MPSSGDAARIDLLPGALADNPEARYYAITKAGTRALADQIDRCQRSAGLVDRLLADEAS